MLFTDDDIEFIDYSWGFERVWTRSEEYIGKYIFISSRCALPQQLHSKKDKTVLVLAGTLLVEIDSSNTGQIENILVDEGESYHIAPGVIHRLSAEESEVELIEASTNEHDTIFQRARQKTLKIVDYFR